MKIIETLTEAEKLSLLQGVSAGIFDTISIVDDDYFDIISEICTGYYFARSGNKTVTPYYMNIYSITKSLKDTNEIMGTIIRDKFRDKWNNIYNSLYTKYSPIEDYSRNERKTFDTTYSKNDITEEDATNTDDIQKYTNSVINNLDTEKINYKNTETVLNDITVKSVWGFNSVDAVDSDKSVNNNKVTSERLADENKTENQLHSENIGNSSENNEYTTEREIKRTESLEGKDTTDTTNSGRNSSAQKLIDEEIKLRIKYIIADIIYKDIDSVLALPIYI